MAEKEELKNKEADSGEQPLNEGGEQGEGQKKVIASRGIPSSDSLYFPPFSEVRKFQDDNEQQTRNLWSLEEVVNFVFPKKYQEKYHEIAVSFMKLLTEKVYIDGSDISSFISQNNISKATFYNRVLPRLRRVGMIKIERETIVAAESRRKYRPMRITLSKTFGNYLIKIGDSWLALVDDARSRRDSEKQTRI
jgi:predicted transcriptional regulator